MDSSDLYIILDIPASSNKEEIEDRYDQHIQWYEALEDRNEIFEEYKNMVDEAYIVLHRESDRCAYETHILGHNLENYKQTKRQILDIEDDIKDDISKPMMDLAMRLVETIGTHPDKKVPVVPVVCPFPTTHRDIVRHKNSPVSYMTNTLFYQIYR